MEMERLIAEAREYIVEIQGRRMMIACLITFDLQAAAQFAGFGDLLAAFDASLSGGLRSDPAAGSERAHGSGLPRA
jgi:hypothetical protein